MIIVDFERLNSKLVHALKQLQLERIRTEIGLHQKIHDLQAEFDAKLLEFDRKRAKIISGEYVPTEKECVYEYADSEFPPPPEITKNGIVSFWPMIFHNLDMISEMIQEHDEPIINHLVDLRCEILKEPRVNIDLPSYVYSYLIISVYFHFRVSKLNSNLMIMNILKTKYSPKSIIILTKLIHLNHCSTKA